ncbi:hypothetical protein TeGR_g7372, partial [Tetraparma gracilis]
KAAMLDGEAAGGTEGELFASVARFVRVEQEEVGEGGDERELASVVASDPGGYTFLDVRAAAELEGVRGRLVAIVEEGLVRAWEEGEESDFLYEFASAEVTEAAAADRSGLEKYLQIVASRGPVTPQTDLATTTLLLKHAASSFVPSSTSAVPSPALLSVFSNFSEQHLAPTFTQFRSALGDSKEDVKEVDNQSGGVDSALFSSYLDLAAKLFQAAPQSAALAGSAVKARTALVSIMRKYSIPASAAGKLVRALQIVGGRESGFWGDEEEEENQNPSDRVKFQTPEVFNLVLRSSFAAIEACWEKASAVTPAMIQS